MLSFKTKRIVFLPIAWVTLLIIESFNWQITESNNNAKNLQVIYPDISENELMKDMKTISLSLGVECRYCHVVIKEGTVDTAPMYDAASDEKQTKLIARDMMRMTNSINTNYLAPIVGDKKSRLITCVTCHMGHITPVSHIDSLFIH